jgi:hypothetical protein
MAPVSDVIVIPKAEAWFGISSQREANSHDLVRELSRFISSHYFPQRELQRGTAFCKVEQIVPAPAPRTK